MIPKKQILILATIAAMGGFGYVAQKIYQNYKTENLSLKIEIGQAKNSLASQQEAINGLSKQVESLKKESAEESEILKKTISQESQKAAEETKKLEEKIKQAETKNAVTQSQLKAQEESASKKISALEEKVSKTTVYDTAAIISQWKPLIASVKCDFRYSDTGRLYYQTSGSGTALKFDNTPSVILTNKHVVTDKNDFGASSCGIEMTNGKNEQIVSSDIRVSSKGYDLGYIYINNPNDYLRNLTAKTQSFCVQQPNLGDEVVVLGYPLTGSKENITATEGIISGFEGDYYITSAKVEQGNSGGAAILLKDNCLLGIPTFVTLGKVESLARILDIKTALDK